MQGIEINCVDVENIRIYLPDENASKQHQLEIGLFLFHGKDDFVRGICKDIYSNVKNTSNYHLFLTMWSMFKYINRYSRSVAFHGLDIWRMKMFVQPDNNIVFVNGRGEVVLDKEKYNKISKALRDEFKAQNLL